MFSFQTFVDLFLMEIYINKILKKVGRAACVLAIEQRVKFRFWPLLTFSHGLSASVDRGYFQEGISTYIRVRD